MFFIASKSIRNYLWKLVFTIDDTIILISDTIVMMGSLHDLIKGSLSPFGTFDCTILTAAMDYKRKSLILALSDSTIWSLSIQSKTLIGNFESPHLICIDHLSRALVVVSIHGLISWWNLDRDSINESKVITRYTY